MRIQFLIGLGLAATILIVTVCLEGLSLTLLFQPAALLLVIGGVLTALCIQFPWPLLVQATRSTFLSAPCENTVQELEHRVEYILELARYIRSKGLLSMQAMVDQVEYPLVQQGIKGLLENRTPEYLAAHLHQELEGALRQRLEIIRIFEAAGGYAPTMGMMGAIIGLARVVQDMQSTNNNLGLGVANAFVATLYGLGLANFVLLPLAGKLRQEAKEDYLADRILVEGMVAIAQEDHPIHIESQLLALLPKAEKSLTDEGLGNFQLSGSYS